MEQPDPALNQAIRGALHGSWRGSLMDGMRLGSKELEGWRQPAPRLTLHPALLSLAENTRMDVEERGAWVSCPRPGHLAVSPVLGTMADGQLILRFGLEFAWLTGLPELTLDAALLLAARAAGGFLQCLKPAPRVPGGTATSLLAVFESLAGVCPSGDALLRAAGTLRTTGVAGIGLPRPGPAEQSRALEQVALLWDLSQACEMLLVSGGDDRLELDRQTGLNRYGCTPWPAPDQVAFASSTASSISAFGQEAAEALRRRMIAGLLRDGDACACIESHTEAAAASILAHFGVADLATAVLTASGTDAALVVTGLLQAEHPGASLTSILMSPAETGSGVPEAVRARHFSYCTASGRIVPKGALLDEAAPGPALLTVALREPDGTPRSREAIAAACASAIEVATAQGRAVLHAIDGTKSGLAAPDRESCAALARRFGGRLDIVIDACQARVEPALVRFYLEHGFPVLVTGSKFFGAPGFCGVVLFPAARLRRILAQDTIAPELGGYATLAGGVLHRRCPGLLLRWEAALADMRRFARMPAPDIRHAIERFGHAVRARIMAAPRLSLHPAPRPAGAGWSGRRSVFTFAVHGAHGPLPASRLRPLYLALAAGGRGPGCLIGQPVEVGGGALRVALSAGQIAEGGDQKHRLDVVFDTLQALLAAGTAP